MITGGILAHDGLLPIWGVAVAASAGACIADQLWFWLARHFQHVRWVEKTKKKPAFKKALSTLEHHLILFTLGFRFIYGMRTVTPIAISASRIRTHTFVLLNIISAAIWGPVMAWLGYGFGRLLAPWLHGPKSMLIGIGTLLVLGVAVVFLLRRSHHKRHDPQAAS